MCVFLDLANRDSSFCFGGPGFQPLLLSAEKKQVWTLFVFGRNFEAFGLRAFAMLPKRRDFALLSSAGAVASHKYASAKCHRWKFKRALYSFLFTYFLASFKAF